LENRLRDALPPVAGRARSLRKALFFSSGLQHSPFPQNKLIPIDWQQRIVTA